MEKTLKVIHVIFIAIVISACGGNDDSSENYNDTVALDGAGETPFIYNISIVGDGVKKISGVSFQVQTKTGNVARPIVFSYTSEYLRRMELFGPHGRLVVPVVGLYDGFNNTVDVTIKYESTQKSYRLEIKTDIFESNDKKNYRPEIISKASSNNDLDFNYFYIKRRNGGPVVYDIDGEIRWTSNAVRNAYSTAFENGHFIVGAQDQPTVYTLELNGAVKSSALSGGENTYTNFHHNIDFGKFGLLAELDSSESGIKNLGSTLAEISSDGLVIKEWDLAKIIAQQMLDFGDSPGEFVRYGIDWFHMNSAIYDKLDDSIIISSRENFIVKIDYETGKVIWIFGDPTKYWYSFLSLRQLAINISEAKYYPIGQHSLSIGSLGRIMLFDNGAGSFNQPPQAPRGASNAFSAVREFEIDVGTKQAAQVYSFDNNGSILSDICSSAYRTSGNSLLINYSVSDAGYLSGNLTPRIVGLNKAGQVAFEFKFQDDSYCSFSWNANFINFESLVLN